MVNPNNYFDLYDIFFNELIGSTTLAIVLILIFVNILLVKSRIPFEAGAIINLLILSIIFAANTGLVIIWILVVMFAAVSSHYMISRAMRRG